MADKNNSAFEPGAAIFGNFINYYAFNPPQNRIKLIPNTLLHDLGLARNDVILCLDVGCNAGNLSYELYKHLVHHDDDDSTNEKSICLRNRLHLLGVDVDEILISRCREFNQFPTNISFTRLDFMNTVERDECLNEHLERHGRCASDKFDLLFAFSITMWIHLNHGDRGLFQFLSTVAQKCRFLVLESQSWKSYLSAQRRFRRLGRDIDVKIAPLKIRVDVETRIEKYLIDECQMRKLDCLGKTSWNRNITLYQSTVN